MKWLISVAAASFIPALAAAFPSLPAPPSVTAQLKDAIRTLSIESEEDRLKAIQEIQKLGPWGSPAVPELTKYLSDGSPRMVAAIADTVARLGPAGKDAKSSLLEIIRRPRLDSFIMASCARAIAAIGYPGNPDMVRAILSVDTGGKKAGSPINDLTRQYQSQIIPVIAEHLSDPDPQIRSRAAMALHRVIHRVEENKPAPIESLSVEARSRIVDQLRIALADSQVRVRDWIVPALIELHPASLREAFTVFVSLIRRREGYGLAQESIKHCGPDAARIVLDYLDDPDPTVRHELAVILANTRGKTLPVLVEGLRNPNPLVRAGVLNALSMNPAQGRSLRAAIVNRLSDDDAQVRFAAAITLVTIDPLKASAAVPVLVDTSFSRNASDRLSAINWLRTMGPEARGAVRPMFRLVHSSDLETRFSAAQALAAIDKSTWQTFVPAFIEAIAFGQDSQRKLAAKLLGETGPKAHSALPCLRGMLSDENLWNRVVCAEAMVQIAPDDIAEPLKILADALSVDRGNQANHRNYRRTAIAAIERIGARAKSTVPSLLELMRNEPNEDVAMLAATAAINLDAEKSEEAFDRFRFHFQPTNPDPDDFWLDGVLKLGKAAKPLIPNFVAAINARLSYQRDAAIAALTMLGPDAKEALPKLKEMAKSKKASSDIDEAIKAIEGKK